MSDDFVEKYNLVYVYVLHFRHQARDNADRQFTSQYVSFRCCVVRFM